MQANPMPAQARQLPTQTPTLDACGRRGRGGCAPADDMAMQLPGVIAEKTLRVTPRMSPVPVRLIVL